MAKYFTIALAPAPVQGNDFPDRMIAISEAFAENNESTFVLDKEYRYPHITILRVSVGKEGIDHEALRAIQVAVAKAPSVRKLEVVGFNYPERGFIKQGVQATSAELLIANSKQIANLERYLLEKMPFKKRHILNPIEEDRRPHCTFGLVEYAAASLLQAPVVELDPAQFEIPFVIDDCTNWRIIAYGSEEYSHCTYLGAKFTQPLDTKLGLV